MWPELLDMTRDESKRILRRVELEAYSSIVSAFRAQGDLTKEKKRLLHDLQTILSISTERHRAEVRRAVNDEKLATIADNMTPSNSTQEWLIEGRRLVPIMPRLVPQTAFTVTANQAASAQAEINAALPSPSQTGIRDVSTQPPVMSPPPTSRPSSPTSNVVVLPSGMSIHIKGGLNTDDEDDVQLRKRRRSTSTDSMISPSATPIPQVTYTTTMASVPTASPKKITISKSPVGAPRVVASGSQTQKVILVSSASGMSNNSNIVQKSITVPVVKTTASVGTSTTSISKSIIVPGNSIATNTSIANVEAQAVVTTAGHSSIGKSVIIPCNSIATNASIANVEAETVVTTAGQSSIGKPGNSIATNTSIANVEAEIVVTTAGQSSIGKPGNSIATNTSIANVEAETVVTTAGQSSIGKPGNSIATNTSIANVEAVTVVTTAGQSSIGVSSQTVTGTSTTAFLTPTISVTRPRYKTIPRQKILQLPPQRPGVVIPMGPQPVQPSPQVVQGVRQTGKQTPTIQIRHEGGMRIITQNVPGGTSTKILPKPGQLTSPSGAPVVVVSAGSSQTATSTVAMLNRPITTITGSQSGAKVLNIQTQGGKILSGPRGSSVVTVNPKTLHLTTMKGTSGITGTKPNVIVVQKTQPRRSVTGGTPGKTTAVISSPFEKELVSFLQKQDPTKQYVVTTTTANLSKPVERKVIVTTPAHGDIARQITQSLQRSKSETDSKASTSTLLHDLIQAVGIMPDGSQGDQSGEVTLNLDESQLAALSAAATSSTQQQQLQAKGTATQSLPNNEWFEYDVTDEQGNTFTHTAESADTAAAIQSLLDMQSNGSQQKPKVTVQRSASIDIGQLSDQLNQQQFYTIEQAMTILNQTEKDQNYEQHEGQTQSTTIAPDGFATDPNEVLTAEPISSSNISISIEQPPGADGNYPQDDSATSQDVGNYTQEVVSQSDLDPQSGVLYTDKVGNIIARSAAELIKKPIKVTVAAGQGPQQVVRTEEVQGQSSEDLLSSSLAQAQIDLDPFRFIDDGSLSKNVSSSDNSVEISVEKAGQSGSVNTSGTEVQTIPKSDTSSIVQTVVVTQPITTTTPAVRIQPSSFIPIQDIARSSAASTINITTQKQSAAIVSVASEPSIHVRVEHSGLDTSHMKIEDFTSQQHLEPIEYVGIDHMEEICSVESPSAGSSGLSDSQGEGSIVLDTGLQQSRKKRKTSTAEEGQMGASVTGWVRAAQGVLNKVSKYRGVNRDKNELNAAFWFTQPVDPSDAPDYYNIVENPMDFGTIRKRLEGGKYQDFDDFHSDMMLVRDNCCLYNPEQSVVRRDCDDVFSFYQQEYDKLMDKWQKTHIGSPVSKKQRLDKSPISRP